MAKQVFHQDLEGIGEAIYMAFLDCIEAIDIKIVAADCELGTCAEAVRHLLFSGFLRFLLVYFLGTASRPQGCAL